MASFAPVPLAFNCMVPDGYAKHKAPIIFLHGVTACKEYWYDIPQQVADVTKRKVYAMDARNHGDSPWTDDFNFDCNVVDLLHIMDTLNIPKAIIVGHSMGGLTGMKTALKSPERVEKLVVEDISLRKIPQPILDTIKHKLVLAKAAVERIPDGLGEEEARKYVMNDVFSALPPEVQKLTRLDEKGYMVPLKKRDDGKYTFKTNIEVLERAMTNTANTPPEPEGVYEGPACFIYGQLSPFLVGSDASDIKRFFPKAELAVVDSATHSVHIDNPEGFTDALLNFLMSE